MQNLYDLIIIGAGTAGLSASIYAGRAKLKTLIIDKDKVGGQIKITAEVVNYPGVLHADGADLSEIMRKQAVNFGVEFASGEIAKVDFCGDIKNVITTSGEVYSSVAVIIASGAKPRKLGFEGETEYAGRGIAYCATCDGEFFAGKDIFVIGSGFSAAEEAIYLTRFGRKITVISREPEFTCAKSVADKVLAHDKIDVHFSSEIEYVKGKGVVKEAKFRNNHTGESWIHKVEEGTFGVFIFVGYEPESAVYKDQIEVNDRGYIITDEDMQTNVAGIYAAGDIRPKRLRQLVTATADGAIASTAAEKYIEDAKHRLGITIEASEPKDPASSNGDSFEDDTAEQIRYVMDRCTGQVSINAILNPDCKLSDGIRSFLTSFTEASDKMPVNIYEKGENSELERKLDGNLYPIIALMDKDGNYTGASFNAVPVGHEMESFVLAIYNAAGPGQAMSDDLKSQIISLKPVEIKIGISLSCTMCPDLVQAAQRIAIINKDINASMIDLQHFPEIRDRFDVMSVPVMIINDSEVLFGKKSLEEMVDYLSRT